MTGSAISWCSLACAVGLSALTACSGSKSDGPPTTASPFDVVKDVVRSFECLALLPDDLRRPLSTLAAAGPKPQFDLGVLR